MNKSNKFLTNILANTLAITAIFASSIFGSFAPIQVNASESTEGSAGGSGVSTSIAYNFENQGSVALKFDTSKYTNQSAKIVACQSSYYLGVDEEKISYSSPIYPQYNFYKEEDFEDVNDAFYMSFNLNKLDDKFEASTYISKDEDTKISLFDITRVVFEDDKYNDFWESFDYEKDTIDYNDDDEILINNEYSIINDYRTSFNFCNMPQNYPGQTKLNDFQVRSAGQKTYRSYILTAQTNNFTISSPTDIVGKDLAPTDISNGKCLSYRNAWVYDQETGQYEFDTDEDSSKVAPGGFVDCTFDLKEGVFYNPINGFFDEKSGEYYSNIEIKPQVIRPTFKRNGCYIGRNYDSTEFESAFKDNVLYCNFGIPFSAKSGEYGVDLDFFANPGPNATSQTAKNVAKFTVDRDLIQPFSDVELENTFSDYIYGLKDLGVISGTGDGDFNPDGNVSRGEMSKFVKNTFFGNYYTNDNCEPFSDVDTNNTFYYEITTLKCEGVIGGFADGRFKPEDSVNRGQALKFMVEGARAAAKDQSLFDTDEPTKVFPDVNSGNTFYDYIVDGVANGIAGGYGDGTFQPNRNIKREEMSKIVLNTWEKAGLDKRGEQKDGGFAGETFQIGNAPRAMGAVR